MQHAERLTLAEMREFLSAGNLISHAQSRQTREGEKGNAIRPRKYRCFLAA